MGDRYINLKFLSTQSPHTPPAEALATCQAVQSISHVARTL